MYPPVSAFQPNLMPSRPVLSASGIEWHGADLQLYRHPQGGIDHPPIADGTIAIHTAGKVFLEDTSLTFKRDGWASAGCISLNPAGKRLRREWRGRPEVLALFLEPFCLSNLAEGL